MWKRAVRVVVTFGVLVAGCAGYGQGFALLSRWVGVPSVVPILPYNPSPARSEQLGLSLAAKAFGPDHWTADRDERMCYYDVERGIWFFFKRYERKNDGQRIEFEPFALIWKSKRKENLSTVLGRQATVDFDKPFDLAPSGGEPPKVVYAKISGEVRLKDDKGSEAPGDDLVIGPMQDLEYREPQHALYTESRVVLREKDLTAETTGMTVELRLTPAPADRPEAKSSGYSSAKSITLHRNIQIHVADVGRTGLVPGGAEAGERRPGNLTADGPARIDLPEPRPKDAPPGDPKPIVAQFAVNVCLRQGGPELPDQLNADTLRLTLFPVERPARDEAAGEAGTDTATATKAAAAASVVASADSGVAEEEDPSEEGRLSTMELKLAEAKGHAVWVQSPSQGFKARGNELLYERRAPEQADSIYFRGDTTTWVEKERWYTEGDLAGQIRSIDGLWAQDITILQPTAPGQEPTIIARGPGRMQTSPGKGLPVEQSATWTDRLQVRGVETQVGPRREVELSGSPRLISPSQGQVQAEEAIVAYLVEKESGTEASAGGSEASGEVGGGSFRIDWVKADERVLLTTAVPPAKPGEVARPPDTLEARHRLNVTFAPPETATATATAGAEAAAPAGAAAGGANAGAGATTTATPPGGARAATAAATTTTAAADENKPPAQPLHAAADVVWARMRLASAGAKPELDEVQLQDNVTLHQEPAPGKERGTDAAGSLVIFQNRGPGQGFVEARGTLDRPARISSESITLDGAQKIQLDQASDVARVVGPGVLTMDPPSPRPDAAGSGEAAVVPTAYLAGDDGEDQAPEGATAESPARKLNGPVTVAWQKDMTFYGQPRDVAGRPQPAYAIFNGDVRAWTIDPEQHSESFSRGDRMRASFNDKVSFQKMGPRIGSNGNESGGEATAAEDGTTRVRPKLVAVQYQGQARVLHRLRNETSGVLEQQAELRSNDLRYSVETGYFEGLGKGELRLHKRGGSALEGLGGGLAGRDGQLRPTSFLLAQDGAAGAAPGAAPAEAALEAMELTKVSYLKKVEGRMMPDRESSPDTPFQAKFIGGVQVIQAKVRDESQDVSVDDLPADFLFLAGDQAEVIRERPLGGVSESEEGAAMEQFFIDVTGRQPMARDAQKGIKGDRITYDSSKELVYVYGEQNGVTITSQDGVGQPFSAARVRAIMYNRQTGDVRLVEPQGLLLIDPRSGIRSAPVPPGQPRDVKPKKPPTPIRRVPSGDKERKGFSGR